jgi:hypothetical protein
LTVCTEPATAARRPRADKLPRCLVALSIRSLVECGECGGACRGVLE